jgi:hypothetical protein
MGVRAIFVTSLSIAEVREFDGIQWKFVTS